MELLLNEQAFTRNEVLRLREERRRLKHKPELRHAYAAVRECAVEYRAVGARIAKDLELANEAMNKIWEEFQELEAEMEAFEEKLDGSEAAMNAIQNVVREVRPF